MYFGKYTYGALVGLMMLCFGCQPTQEAVTPPRPNFILIQLDDLGWDDLALHGNTYLRTPHLDTLGMRSLQFDQFYVNPVCAPTRASLLTGRHFLRTGVSHVHGGKDYLNLGERTLGDLMKRAGYATGIWGKWHSGTGPGYDPWERGFDEAYVAQLYAHRNPAGNLNGDPVAFPGKWSAEVIVDYALNFMETHQDRNFLTYLSFLTCHEPLDAPDSLVAYYTQQGLSSNLATLYGMIDLLDQQIGRLLEGVQTLGLSEQTVIIFLSDNGPAINNHSLSDADRAIRYVNGYHGHKGNLWENGVKSPLFIHWPGNLQPGHRRQLVDVTDLLPTILELAGAELPSDQRPLDGHSLCPILQDAQHTCPDKLTFDYANPGWPPTDQPWTPQGIKDEYRPLSPLEKASLNPETHILSVRNNRFKLMRNVAQYTHTPPLVGRHVLIDLKNDPHERTNIAGAFPKEETKLKKALNQWFEDIKASPASFESPVFILRDSILHMPVKGAFALDSGLTKTFNWVEGWDKVGEQLHLRLQVETAGTYVAKLRTSSASVNRDHWAIIIGEQRLIFSGTSTDREASLTLSAGLQEMSLSWLGGEVDADLKVFEIILKKHQ